MNATVCIAASVDGVIARENGDLEWLHEAGARAERRGLDDAVLSLVVFLLWLAVIVYGIVLATRLVTAVEQIARSMSARTPDRPQTWVQRAPTRCRW